MRNEATMGRLDVRRILCPVDFSRLSSGALATAGAMARARNAELRALHVVPTEGAAAPAGLGSLERERLMVRLRELLDETDLNTHLIGAAVRQGDPGTEILGVARAIPADLIVMGVAGADRPERPAGSVTSVVVARSECPVLTVPVERTRAAADAGVFNRIVCAVDPAPSSTAVIRQALSLAWETHGRVTCVYVQPNHDATSSSDVRRRLLAAVPPDANHWCELEVIVSMGVAGVEIVRIAEAVDADLVVIGPPRRWTSTAHAVLSTSCCPVLVAHDARPLPKPVILDTYAAGGMAV